MTTARFKKMILDHYKLHKRAMPWRNTKDPYKILVSEVMLQQTQVSRVMKFYPKFIRQFPDFRSLARARTEAVLRAWQGLGYNRRALNLQRLSRIVLERFNGRLPREREELEDLPGIGKGTSGALRTFIWNESEVFIETNIRRVFIHFFFPRRRKVWLGGVRRRGVTDEELKRYIKRTLPRTSPREWYWALMDYGAMLGSAGVKNGAGDKINPNRRSAQYRKQPGFKGSDRELRGKVLRLLLKKKKISLGMVAKTTGETLVKVKRVSAALAKEGFAKQKGSLISVL